MGAQRLRISIALLMLSFASCAAPDSAPSAPDFRRPQVPLWSGWPGEGASVWGSGSISEGAWILTQRVVFPQDTNRAPLEYSLFHVLNESLQVGIEYDYAEDQFHPAAAYRLL